MRDSGTDAQDAGDDAELLDSSMDGGGTEDASVDAPIVPVVDSGPDASPVSVDVSHRRELRAMWVTTVFGLDFPSSPGLTEVAARAELSSIVDEAVMTGMNALFFQVRPEGDAFYTSSIEPWSRFLTGTQGTAPGYDPLAILLELAHPRGIEVHAWINPFRGVVNGASSTDPLSPVQRFPEAAVSYNNQIIMNPASEAVRDHILAVIVDLTMRFDIDGVIFDDYFYPYPDSLGTEFPDSVEYGAYTNDGGTLSRSDWRRSNINAMIAAVGPALQVVKPWVRWGVAPFGIYRPGFPEGIVGTDAYEVLGADAVHWMTEGWVDYIAPQLYWTSDSGGQPFGPLVEWWAGIASPDRPVIPTLALFRFGLTSSWTIAEFENQIALTRAQAPTSAGASWFRQGFAQDPSIQSMFSRIYSKPARPPALPERGDAVELPNIMRIVGGVIATHSTPTQVSGYAVYREEGGTWELESWHPGQTASIPLPMGHFAISTISRAGVESRGVDVEVL